MTLDELRRAIELLPEGTTLTLSREALREALARNGDDPDQSLTNSVADRLLTVRETATRLGVSTRYLYAHRDDFPFVRQLPGGAVRFSECGLAAWLARKV